MSQQFGMIGKISTFLSPNKVIFGFEAARLVGQEAKGIGADKALIVTDEAVMGAGLIRGIEKSLASAGLHTRVFDKVEAEPPARIVDECLQVNEEEKYARIARAMGERDENLSLYDRAEGLVSHIKRLLGILNISFKISDYGVSREDIPRLVEGALKQSRLFVPNPRDLMEEDVRNIYLSAF